MAYSDGVFSQGPVAQKTVTIANGATDSSVIDMEGHNFMALLLPAALTGTSFTFKGSQDNSTYTAIYDDAGAAVSITVSTSRWVGIGSTVMAKLAAFRYLKFVSSGAEGGARTIEVVLK